MTPDQAPGADAHETYLDHILADYLDAEDDGCPDRERLLRAHPELAADLARFFASYDRLEGLLGPLRQATGAASRRPPPQPGRGPN